MNQNRSIARPLRVRGLAPLRSPLFDDVLGRLFEGASFENGFFPRLAEAARASEFVPSLEWTDTKEAYVLRAEVPGLDHEQVDVHLEDDTLVLSGEKRTEEKREEDEVLLTERSFGRFERRLRLPGPVDESKVSADMKNGVLEVVLPKAQEKESRRRIEIRR